CWTPWSTGPSPRPAATPWADRLGAVTAGVIGRHLWGTGRHLRGIGRHLRGDRPALPAGSAGTSGGSCRARRFRTAGAENRLLSYTLRGQPVTVCCPPSSGRRAPPARTCAACRRVRPAAEPTAP